jgi:phosphonate transport system substrate-binding protein
MGRGLALLPLWLAAACAPEPAPQADALQVLLIPADGGTQSGTLADYQPLFDAVAQSSGMTFDLTVAQSYSAVVEAMCNGTADIAFVGPVTFLQARHRGCAELLAVAVKDRQSTYHAAIFVRQASPVRDLADLRGRSIALGDVNSTSAFVFPVAMLLDAGLDPARDLAAIRMTGAHSGNLAALVAGQVDAAAMSLESYDKALRSGFPGAIGVRAIARSEAIPYPPLVMNVRLPAARKQALRRALDTIAEAPGITPEMIRGYGGAMVDGYEADVGPERFDGAARKMALLDDALIADILAKAAER